MRPASPGSHLKCPPLRHPGGGSRICTRWGWWGWSYLKGRSLRHRPFFSKILRFSNEGIKYLIEYACNFKISRLSYDQSVKSHSPRLLFYVFMCDTHIKDLVNLDMSSIFLETTGLNDHPLSSTSSNPLLQRMNRILRNMSCQACNPTQTNCECKCGQAPGRKCKCLDCPDCCQKDHTCDSDSEE